MKKLLLSLMTFLLFFHYGNAQTVTWTGAGPDTNWDTVANWNTGVIPTVANDVIIPTGFTVTLNVAGTVKSINLQGTSVLEMNSDLTFENASISGANTTINWTSGIINGTSSTFTNLGVINLTTTGNHVVNGTTTIINQGTFNFTDSGDLFLNQESILFNPASGVLDFQADSGNITYNINPIGSVINVGLIKKTTSSGEAEIGLPVTNNDGIIQVEVGTLSFQDANTNFNDGTYNVFASATMDWDNTINFTGTITGTVVGDLNWNYTLNVPTGETVFLNFLETDNFNWKGSLSGGGTLTNTNILNFSGTFNSSLNGNSTLENQGTIIFTGGGNLFVNQGSTLHNPLGKTIDFRVDGGNISYNINPIGLINNEGLIKKTTSLGEAQIGIPINNNDGIIQVEVGTLSFQDASTNLFDGTYNVFAGATMDWDNTVNFTGTITGTVVGDLNWNYTLNVPTGETVFLNFLETDNFNWKGSLSGGGTLTNTNILNFSGTFNSSLNDNSTLENQGTIIFSGGGNLLVNQGSTLYNPLGKTIDFRVDGGNISYNINPIGIINNEGLIKKTTSLGEAQIGIPINNNDGIIQVEVGTLSFQDANTNFNDGTYNVFAGATMDWDNTINPSGTLTGTVVGDLNWNSTLNVPTGETVFLNFLETDNFNWIGVLSGGGTLTNTNILNFSGTFNSSLNGNSTLENQGTIIFSGGGDLLVNQGSTLHNPLGKTIDFRVDDGNISYNVNPIGLINNEGLIKKTTSSGEAQIGIPINNNDGIIQVEEGTLSFQNASTNLFDGTYNVYAGAIMDWDNTINPSGTLTGTVVGDLNWNSTLNIPTGETVFLNFLETDNFNWIGVLSGGGKLTNINVIKIASNNAAINGTTTLENQGIINFTDGGDLFINQESVFNNLANGSVDMQSDGGNISYNINPSGVFNNAGLIKKTTSTGIAQIAVQLNNSGTIEVQSGELEHTGTFPFTNEATGTVKGVGIFDLPAIADYTNNGTFAPGLSPGILTVQGDFKSSSTSILDVELNGLTTGTEYDVLAISGTNNEFDGAVNVTLGFEPIVGNTFTVATTTGTITTKNLTTPFTTDYLGFRYTFAITYPDDNSVQLEVTTILDIEAPTVVTQNVTVQLDASGNASVTAMQIDNGSSDNFSLATNLTYSLDLTTFTCAELGQNTVTLTVTDEANNAATGTAIVTVVDSIDPIVTCGSDLSVTSGGSYILPDYIANNIAVVSDNCSVTLEQTPVAGTSLANGTYTISFIAVDSSENTTSCSFELTISGATDTEAPTVVTQNVTVQLDVSGNAVVMPSQVNNGSTDNVTSPANLTYSLDITTFTCADLGSNTVTLTVTDEANNAASGTAIVTVEDVINPEIICGVNITVNSDGNYSLPNYITNETVTASDNCNVTLIQTPAAGTVLTTGIHTISFTASDSSNNTNNCSFDLTINNASSITWYADTDSDGYGDNNVTLEASEQPVGYVLDNSDCDDTDNTIFPGATEICYDGILQNCNGTLTNGCALITATLRSENCNSTLTSIDQVVRGNNYSQSIPSGVSVTSYRFKVTNMVTNQVRIIERSNYIFQLTYTDFADYNTTYSVEVEIRLNQEWMGVYGAVCTITTPGVPNTVLTNTSCGATLAQMNNIIRAEEVPSALNYEYNVALIEGGSPIETTTFVRSGASFNLLQLSNISIKFASEYQITIRVQVPTSSGLQWSTMAGASCSVFTPAAPAASIEGCGGEAGVSPATMNTVIYASPIGGATQYRFTLTNEMGYNQVYTTPSRFFKLSNFNALQVLTLGNSYSVKVEVAIYGNYYQGNDCNIVVPGGLGIPVVPITRTNSTNNSISVEFKAVAYPNPFANSFSIDLRSNSSSEVSLAIYNMTGRLLETRNIKADGLSSQTIGERYPAGIYNVIVNQGENTQMIRVVKQ